MTQYNPPVIDPNVDTGTSLSGIINNWVPAVISNHAGNGRPTYAVAGTIWYDTDVNKPFYFTGSQDVGFVLSSDLSGYLPLSGGTLTGPLGGTAAQFNTLAVRGDTSIQPASGNANLSVLSTNGGAVLEIGGSSFAYIDLKAPSTDDYDLRISSDTVNSAISGKGILTLSGGNSASSLTLHTNGIVYSTGRINAPLLEGGDGGAGHLRCWNVLNTVCFTYATNGQFSVRIDEAVQMFLPMSTNIDNINSATNAGSWSLQVRQADASYAYVIYDGFSDARLKSNIALSTEDALAKLCSLDVVQHDWNESAVGVSQHSGHVDLSLIAQQIKERVHPSLVSEMPMSQEGEAYLMPNYRNLVPWLVKAVQQLSARVAELEAKK